MYRLSFLSVAFWLLTATFSYSAEAVGFREVELDSSAARKLHAVMWYPTESSGKAVTVGENAVFYGISAIRDAAPDTNTHPVVILSHGYGGSWRNLSWLAEGLAKQGYVVAAPDHPGTTTFNKDSLQAAELWQRPRDLSRVIDALLAEQTLAGKIDAGRIAAIGHSLGGWTVAALAGARFETTRFEKDCQENFNPRTCNLKAELGLGNAELEKDMRDPRLGAFVSLDLGLARGFARSLTAGPDGFHG